MSTAEKASDAQRMANTGKEITLKKLGKKVTVKELTMESVIKCAVELSQLLAVIDFNDSSKAAVVLQVILQSEPTAKAFRVFAAESTETTPLDWTDAPAGDWLRFVRAAKEVNDWEELRELFTELGLSKTMFQAQTTEPKPPSPDDVSPTPQAS